MVLRSSLIPARMLLMLALACAAARARAEMLPLPTVTIYPGDTIKAEILTDRETFTTLGTNGAVFATRERLVGKVARRTLLPGRPIALNAVGEPKAVTAGAMAKVVYQDGMLTIATYATVLQAGAPGDLVSVRNLESGRIIAGIVQADGSIRVSAD